MSDQNLILLDGDVRRRASISHCLSGAGFHVEPFESLDELTASFPSEGILLVQDISGLVSELVKFMTTSGHWLPIVCFDEQPEPTRVAEAVLSGAVDYLNWPFAADELDAATRRWAIRWVELKNAAIRQALAQSRIERLTRREREVLAAVSEGLSNRNVGLKLQISPRTVEIHRANMLSKLGASHTSQAIRIAVESALIC